MVGMQTDVVIHYVLRFETIRLVAFAKINFRITVFGRFIRFYLYETCKKWTLKHKHTGTILTTQQFVFILEWQLNLIFSFFDYITLHYGHSRRNLLRF